MAKPEFLQTRVDAWLERRLPVGREVTLNQRRIFIVPSKTAAALLVMILVLFLLGINFQNSLVYVVCFWLLALLVINIFYTYRNLSGLTIAAMGVESCFAGEKAVLELELTCPGGQPRYALQFAWPGEDETQLNLVSSQTARIKLSHTTERRGVFRPQRIHVSTRYPTGLAVAWSYVTLEVKGVVYPRPLEKKFNESANGQTEITEDGLEIKGGSSDFGGIRAYQAGDGLRHIHWGKYAQTGQLYTKSFVDYASHDLWLDWDALPLPGIEIRLSHLCSKVLEFHQAQRNYGLKIPGTLIEPASGEAHKIRCLRALALYGVDDE